MEEYLPQMIHSGSRKKQENLTIPAKKRPAQTAPHTLQDPSTAPAGPIFAQILAQDAEINSEQSHKVSNP